MDASVPEVLFVDVVEDDVLDVLVELAELVADGELLLPPPVATKSRPSLVVRILSPSFKDPVSTRSQCEPAVKAGVVWLAVGSFTATSKLPLLPTLMTCQTVLLALTLLSSLLYFPSSILIAIVDPDEPFSTQ